MECKFCKSMQQQFQTLKQQHEDLQSVLVAKASQNSIFSPTYRRVEIPDDIFVDVEDKQIQTISNEISTIATLTTNFNNFDQMVNSTLLMLEQKLTVTQDRFKFIKDEILQFQQLESVNSAQQRTIKNLNSKLYVVSPINSPPISVIQTSKIPQIEPVQTDSETKKQQNDNFYQKQNETLQEQIKVLTDRLAIYEEQPLSLSHSNTEEIISQFKLINQSQQEQTVENEKILELENALNELRLENSTIKCQLTQQNDLNESLRFSQNQLESSQKLQIFNENVRIDEMQTRITSLEIEKQQFEQFGVENQVLKEQNVTIQQLFSNSLEKYKKLEMCMEEVEKLYRDENGRNLVLENEIISLQKQLKQSQKTSEACKIQEKKLLEKINNERKKVGIV